MSDKVQEIRQALANRSYVPEGETAELDDNDKVVIENCVEWLSFLLADLDTANEKKEEIQTDLAMLKFAHKDEIKSLQQQLDAAKVEIGNKETELKLSQEGWALIHDALRVELDAAKQENERLKRRLLIRRDTCGGSGFTGYGTGYDAVCDDCTSGFYGEIEDATKLYRLKDRYRSALEEIKDEEWRLAGEFTTIYTAAYQALYGAEGDGEG